jgi:hypothetical protein
MKRSISTLVVALALASAVVSAQKPSFVGTWKISADAPPDPFTPPQIVVAQDATTMTVTTSTQMGDFKTTYKLDGTESRSPIDFNGTTVDRLTKMSWEGSKLVMDVKSEVQGQSFDTKAVWSLAPDGTLLVEVTRPDFQGGGGPVTTKLTYKKG